MDRRDEDGGRLSFGADPLADSSPIPDDELLEQVAQRVSRMGLGVAAIFFLESSKPLTFLGSQALTFFAPFVKAFLTVRTYDQFARLMEDRENVERLIRRIEYWEESPESPPAPPKQSTGASWLDRFRSGRKD